jgi:hypothetical protein
MPAFIRTNSCKIYFSLSKFNDVSDIKNVQVVVNNQKTNLSALNGTSYPSGIKIASLQTDNSIKTEYKYYVTLKPSDMINGSFELNQYYKVQLRFTGVQADSVPSSKKIASWLVSNQGYFSEWSTVCLIKGIPQPKILINGFEKSDSTSIIYFANDKTDFVGKMYFDSEYSSEKEYLSYYTISIYNKDTKKTVYSSDIIYTDEYDPNTINYSIPVVLNSGVNYSFTLKYYTINGYSGKVSYSFMIMQTIIDSLDVSIFAEPDDENGRMVVTISPTSQAVFNGNITIRRSCGKDNFNIWRDIKTDYVSNGTPLSYTFLDYSIESGEFYKYCVQERDTNGNRGVVVRTKDPAMCVFNHVFLMTKNMQLKIKYNPSISSFKETYSDSITETIGGQYPIIRRNGNLKYKQFPISGLITAFCDEDGVFLNKDNIYDSNKQYYELYNKANSINDYTDVTYERKFREKIADFLYDNSVKLFKSATEGNILVKLIDVSFTPEETIGRMIYTFSANAYEIAECSIDNYINYNIIEVGTYRDYETYSENKSEIGQATGSFSEFSDYLDEKYNVTANGIKTKHNGLSWVRITFNDEPYAINCYSDGSVSKNVSGSSTSDYFYGYIVYINNQSILVNQDGIYEVKDDNITINSIYFPYEENVTIDYTVNLNVTQVSSDNVNIDITKTAIYKTKVGQIIDTFDVNESVYELISNKYRYNNKKIYVSLLAIDKLRIETDEGAIIYIKDSSDTEYNVSYIGETGILEIFEEDTTFSDFYFGGRRLTKTTSSSSIQENQYYETGKSYSSTSSIASPIANGVYTIDSKKKIYYREEWYDFSDGVVSCPIEAIVDYIYETEEGEV